MTLFVVKLNDIYYLRGKLDETADFGPLNLKPPVRFNMAEVVSINSIGIGILAGMAAGIGHQNITYEQVPEHFISQANTVSSILGFGRERSKVDSFFVSHICPNCAHESRPLFATADLANAEGYIETPTATCPACNTSAEIDVDPEEFFGFLTD